MQLLSTEVQAALIAAAGAVVLAALTALAKFLGHRAHRRLQTRIRYLYPLKLACDDLLERWRKLALRIEEGDGAALMADFQRVAPSTRDANFYRCCNGHLCGPVGTLHATACYFAYAVKLREQLPLVEVSSWRAAALLRAMEDVRSGLACGDQYGFWTEIQDNIGRLVTLPKGGRVIPFDAFCSVLSRGDGSFDRLFEFYEQIEKKYPHQLRAACGALARVVEILNDILGAPPAPPVRWPTWQGAGSAKADAPRVPATDVPVAAPA